MTQVTPSCKEFLGFAKGSCRKKYTSLQLTIEKGIITNQGYNIGFMFWWRRHISLQYIFAENYLPRAYKNIIVMIVINSLMARMWPWVSPCLQNEPWKNLGQMKHSILKSRQLELDFKSQLLCPGQNPWACGKAKHETMLKVYQIVSNSVQLQRAFWGKISSRLVASCYYHFNVFNPISRLMSVWCDGVGCCST